MRYGRLPRASFLVPILRTLFLIDTLRVARVGTFRWVQRAVATSFFPDLWTIHRYHHRHPCPRTPADGIRFRTGLTPTIGGMGRPRRPPFRPKCRPR